MELAPGTDLLHYRLIEKIGEGGMGVVWKATDTTLGREVAIKLLPPDFAADAERLARFDREARTLASLNHPHIAGIYGVHQAAGRHFISMELIAGEDLAQRLERGAMPLEEALRVARDVAIGLEAAHESGVIHRDLKPANVRLTREGRAKVLDFGLAKAADGTATGDISRSPTMTSAGTVAGMILGTAAYMSPEQAAGQPVDRRVDIWSFGVLLYEMLSGQRMFAGETISHTLADVLRAKIDLTNVPPSTPRPVVRLLERCLERNVSRRLRDIGEARIALDDAIERPQPNEAASPAAGSPSSAGASRLAWLVGALGIVAAAASLSWIFFSHEDPREPTLQFMVEMANAGATRQSAGASIAISPDGKTIVTRGGAGSDDELYLRSLDRFDLKRIEGTVGAAAPQFSPDGRWILFNDGGQMQRVRPTGGAAMPLDWVPMTPQPYHWAADGFIYYSRDGKIWRAPEERGESELLTPDDPSIARGFINPFAIPEAGIVLFNTRAVPGSAPLLFALDLKTRQLKNLEMPGADPEYLPTGQLLFSQPSGIAVADFDPDAREFTGAPNTVLERAAVDDGRVQVAVSSNGTVAYIPATKEDRQSLVFVDLAGAIEPVLSGESPVVEMNDPRVSPDGQRIAVSSSNGTIWSIDLPTQTATLMSESGFYPLWSPDGKELIYASSRGASYDIYRVPVDLSRPEELLLDVTNNMRTMDWTRNGVVVLREEIPDKGMDLRYWRNLEDPADIAPLLDGIDDELAPDVSLDGAWVAYVSDYSKADEIYVTSFPQPGARLKISNSGGDSPCWAPDGKTLYYMHNREMIAVTVERVPQFRVVERRTLFSGDFAQYRWSRQYDMMPDGKRFVMVKSPPAGNVEVITNWFAELRALQK